MKTLSSALAILAALAAQPLPSSGTAPASPVILDDSQSARTIIAGRVVNVEVQVGSDGSAGVRLSTLDRRGLPPIAGMRLRVIERYHAVWDVFLTPIQPSRRYAADYDAAGGPALASGRLMQARIDIASPRTSTSVHIPVTIDQF